MHFNYVYFNYISLYAESFSKMCDSFQIGFAVKPRYYQTKYGLYPHPHAHACGYMDLASIGIDSKDIRLLFD